VDNPFIIINHQYLCSFLICHFGIIFYVVQLSPKKNQIEKSLQYPACQGKSFFLPHFFT